MDPRHLLCFVLLVGCSRRETPRPAPPPPDAPAAPAPAPEVPAAPAPAPEVPEAPPCSASGLRVVLPEQDLPEPVAATRARLAGLAAACAYDDLEALARASGRPFHFTFGDETSPAATWRAAEAATPAGGLGPLAALVRVLALTPCRQEVDGRTWWIWPAVQCDGATEAAWDELRALYDDEAVASFRTYGAYLGWRTAIVEDGSWAYLVAGD